MSTDPYRIFPKATKIQREELRSSIESVGISNPVCVDEHRQVIDGHERRDAAEILGHDWLAGADVRIGLSDLRKKSLAIEMNLWRRPISLTRQKRNELIEIYLLANPELADDRIGSLFGVSQPTINRRRRALIQMNKLKPVEATIGKDGVKRKVGARWICESGDEFDSVIPNIRVNDVHGLLRLNENETFRPFGKLQSHHTDSIHLPQTEYSTPDWLFDQLDDEFHFTLDVAASPENAKCPRYFTSDDDGLSQSWGKEICWMNPPFHRHLIGDWVRKGYEESRLGATVIMLLPTFYREYAWWKQCCVKGEVRFIHPFVRFQRCDGEGTALKDVVVIVLGKKYKPMTSGPVIGMKQTSA